MSTDRELLELAAKAAGYTLRWYEWTELYGPTLGIEIEPGNPLGFEPWNPLTDDGDALRLAVNLEMEVYHADDEGMAAYASWPSARGLAYAIEPHKKDRMLATRRAIVRAAAEIGRSMP